VPTVDLPPLDTAVPRPRALPGERIVVGSVRFASRVGDQLLVLAGTPSRPTDRPPSWRPGATRIDSRHMALPHAEPVPLGDGRTGVATGFLAAVTTDWPTASAAGAARPRERAGHAGPAVRRAGRRAGAGLGGARRHRRRAAQARRGLPGRVASPPGNAPYRRQVAQKLHAVHQTLREALRLRRSTPGVARGLFVDQLYAVDERSFYVRGWMRDADAEVSRLVMVSPEGATVDILPDLARYPRPDVAAFYAEGAAATAPSKDLLGFLAAFRWTPPAGWATAGRSSCTTPSGTRSKRPRPRRSRTRLPRAPRCSATWPTTCPRTRRSCGCTPSRRCPGWWRTGPAATR
jgi:hypothetical protein